MRLVSTALLLLGIVIGSQDINALSSFGEENIFSDNSEAGVQIEQADIKQEAIADDDSLIEEKELQRAEVYLQQDRLDSTKQVLESALQQNPEDKYAAQYLSLLGSVYNRKGQFAKALSNQEEALSKVDTAEQRNLYGQILQRMGGAESDMGDFGSAFKHYLKAIRIAEEVGDSLLLAEGLNKLGVAYNDYGAYRKGEKTLSRAYDIYSSLDNRLGQMKAILNLANTYYQSEEYDKAIGFYNESLKIHKELRSTPPYRIYYNLGQVYKDTGELEKAEQYYKQSLEYCLENDIRQGLVYNYGGLGHVFELNGNLAQAEYYYEQSLSIAREIDAKTLESDALKALYELNKVQDDIRSALQYHEEYTEVEDSLEAEAYEQQLAETESRLSLLGEQEVNRLLREKQEAQEERITAQKRGLIGGAIFILLILVSLYLSYRATKERDQMNAALQEERENLRELNRVKDKLLAIASHDLRSPLSSLKGMLELFKNNGLSEDERQEMVSELEIRLDQNISLLDNLLVWARDQMSGLTISPQSLSVRKVVEEVVAQHRPAAEHKGVTLVDNVRENIRVEADETLLQLVLRNLISNAIKFTDEGDEIGVEAESTGSEILFMVMDSGIGIPPDKQKEIFSINSVSRAGTHNEQGSGLGLGLCKEFINKMNGSISVESEVGEGTSLIFSLPKAHPETMEPEQ